MRDDVWRYQPWALASSASLGVEPKEGSLLSNTDSGTDADVDNQIVLENVINVMKFMTPMALVSMTLMRTSKSKDETSCFRLGRGVLRNIGVIDRRQVVV